MKYRATQRYTSDYCRAFGIGPIEEGAEVELRDEQAEAINRDSPGTLVPATKAAAAPAPAETGAKPAARQARGGQNRMKTDAGEDR